MVGLELVVVLGVAILACSVLARRMGVAPPVLLLVVGVPLAREGAEHSGEGGRQAGCRGRGGTGS